MLSLSETPRPGANAALALRLNRLCTLLGLSGASLSLVRAGGLDALATSGDEPGNASALNAQALRTGQSVITAETNAAAPGAARFYVGLLVKGEDGKADYLLSLFDTRPRRASMAVHLAKLAGEAAMLQEVAQLRRTVETQRQTIVDYAAVEEHRRSLFDRASATARIGIWQCNLADESITWTNGVYDLFEMPRNVPVTRDSTLPFYTEESRQRMEAARSAAIAGCSDFVVDCEIVTATGKRRWMRLTGAVESRNGVAYRIFGMKQDITEEKLMADRTRYFAEYDALTGLANRSVFQNRLTQLDERQQTLGAMLLVDLDGFKQVNDTYGHALGDECLKEAAQRLTASCGDAELIARIGGDEFAVLLGADISAADAIALGQHIVAMIRPPLVRGGHHLSLGASVGIAHYRGETSEDLFRRADMALYAAKAAGRNTSRAYAADAA